MKVTGMDFASDLARLLHKRVSSLPGGDRTEIVRFLNIPNNSLSLKISWNSTPIGQVNARIVEEPQDYYLRGAFYPADGSQPTGFTLRPGKEYQKNLESFVETIAFACIGASFSSASTPPSQPPPSQPTHEKVQLFEPGPDFPFSDSPSQPQKQAEQFFQPGEDFPFSDSPSTTPESTSEFFQPGPDFPFTDSPLPESEQSTTPAQPAENEKSSNEVIAEAVVLKPLED